MHKAIQIAFAVFFLAMSGLVSCKSERSEPDATKAPDVFHAPLPAIRHAGGVADLKAWDQLVHKSLSLEDSVDIREAHADHVDISSSCDLGQRPLSFQDTLDGTNLISIFQIIEPTLLIADLENKAAVCHFQIAIVNAGGAKHIYVFSGNVGGMASGTLILSRADGLNLPLAPSTNAMQIFKHGELGAFSVRTLAPDAVNGQILCADFRSRAHQFVKASELSHFEFDDREKIERRPRQICRAITHNQKGQITAFSSLFQLQFPHTPLTVSPSEPFAQMDDGGKVAWAPVILSGSASVSVPIMDLDLFNPSTQAKLVRLPQPGPRVGQITLAGILPFVQSANCPEREGRKIQLARCRASTSNFSLSYAGTVVKSETASLVVRLEPRAHLQINISYLPGAAPLANHFDTGVLAASLLLKERILVQELDESMAVVDQREYFSRETIFPSPSTPGLNTGYFQGLRFADGCCM